MGAQSRTLLSDFHCRLDWGWGGREAGGVGVHSAASHHRAVDMSSTLKQPPPGVKGGASLNDKERVNKGRCKMGGAGTSAVSVALRRPSSGVTSGQGQGSDGRVGSCTRQGWADQAKGTTLAEA